MKSRRHAKFTKREATLQCLFTAIANQVCAGKKVRPLLRRAARRYRRLALSGGRLTALYYRWRAQVSDALSLNYSPANRRPISP